MGVSRVLGKENEMGRIWTPKYRIEWKTKGSYGMTNSAWDTKVYGKPTVKNLEAVTKKYAESMLPGGVNADAGVTIIGARLVKQDTNQIVADVTISP
jgi:hypothetical protein